MNAVSFPEQTVIFGKPKDWKDEDCYGLPIAQTVWQNSDGTNVPCLISCWELTDVDLAEIQKNRKIYLSITGAGMPPVSIQIGSPFPDDYNKEAALDAFKRCVLPS